MPLRKNRTKIEQTARCKLTMAADITRRCGLPEIALRSKRNSARQWMASLTRSGRPNVAPSCISKHQSPRPWVYYPTPPFDTPRQPMPGTTARMRRSAHTPNESSDRSHPFWAFRQEFHFVVRKGHNLPVLQFTDRHCGVLGPPREIDKNPAVPI